jgi:hypothetical protein
VVRLKKNRLIIIIATLLTTVSAFAGPSYFKLGKKPSLEVPSTIKLEKDVSGYLTTLSYGQLSRDVNYAYTESFVPNKIVKGYKVKEIEEVGHRAGYDNGRVTIQAATRKGRYSVDESAVYSFQIDPVSGPQYSGAALKPKLTIIADPMDPRKIEYGIASGMESQSIYGVKKEIEAKRIFTLKEMPDGNIIPVVSDVSFTGKKAPGDVSNYGFRDRLNPSGPLLGPEFADTQKYAISYRTYDRVPIKKVWDENTKSYKLIEVSKAELEKEFSVSARIADKKARSISVQHQSGEFIKIEAPQDVKGEIFSVNVKYTARDTNGTNGDNLIVSYKIYDASAPDDRKVRTIEQLISAKTEGSANPRTTLKDEGIKSSTPSPLASVAVSFRESVKESASRPSNVKVKSGDGAQ